MNEPLEIFKIWINEALNSTEIEPTAMSLATTGKNLKPSVRMVLLKKFDHGFFRFFTNLGSNKAQQISDNSHAAICIFWPVLGRQIRIEGTLKQIPDNEADDYFLSRPHNSQIAAISSKQSEKMLHADEFKNIYEQNLELIKKPQRPESWSGFDLIPNYFEFWEEGENRTHNRTSFEKNNNNWLKSHLYP